MKKNILSALLRFGTGGLLILGMMNRAVADADDKPAAAPAVSAVKRNGNGEMVVTVDAATQKRIKLEVTNLTAAAWQPEVTGHGRVLAPTTLAAAIVDLTAARLSAGASGKELERLKALAADNNASAHTLETAELAANHDRLSWEALHTKFTGDWGPSLAGRKDLDDLVRALSERKESLVRLVLPAGESVAGPVASAQVAVFPDTDQLIAADVIESRLGVDPDTQGRVFLLLVKDRALPWNAAVTGQLSLGGESLSGVEVPAAAVLRHEGRGWVYLQTADDEFTRHEVPLDRLTGTGWFVTGGLATTNVVVTAGAATILSAELSGGGFNTGERD
jgi:hypothetical protein